MEGRNHERRVSIVDDKEVARKGLARILEKSVDHVDLTSDEAHEIRRRARLHGMSVSKYLASIVRRDIAAGWPEGFFTRVAGGWQGEKLHRPDQGQVEDRSWQ